VGFFSKKNNLTSSEQNLEKKIFVFQIHTSVCFIPEARDKLFFIWKTTKSRSDYHHRIKDLYFDWREKFCNEERDLIGNNKRFTWLRTQTIFLQREWIECQWKDYLNSFSAFIYLLFLNKKQTVACPVYRSTQRGELKVPKPVTFEAQTISQSFLWSKGQVLIQTFVKWSGQCTVIQPWSNLRSSCPPWRSKRIPKHLIQMQHR